MKKTIKILLVFVLSLILPLSAEAHKLSIWAYIDGDKVSGEAYFSDGDPAQLCPVKVSDLEGSILCECSTDEEGIFSFPIPDGVKEVKIVISAGMGHVAEISLPLMDGPLKEDKVSKVPSQIDLEESDDGLIRITREELAELIETSVAKEVSPIKATLRELVDPGPSFHDIMGGLGYIIGITSLLVLIKRGK